MQLEILKHAECNDETDTLSLKSTLWVTSTNTQSVELLNNPTLRVYENIILLAKTFIQFDQRNSHAWVYFNWEYIDRCR